MLFYGENIMLLSQKNVQLARNHELSPISNRYSWKQWLRYQWVFLYPEGVVGMGFFLDFVFNFSWLNDTIWILVYTFREKWHKYKNYNVNLTEMKDNMNTLHWEFVGFGVAAVVYSPFVSIWSCDFGFSMACWQMMWGLLFCSGTKPLPEREHLNFS